jgi:hypothetical protein
LIDAVEDLWERVMYRADSLACESWCIMVNRV